jgi:flagellum-specific ATP synthase
MASASASFFDNLAVKITDIPDYQIYGKICGVNGMLLQVKGMGSFVAIGAWCQIIRSKNLAVLDAEVVGFDGDIALMMPFGDVYGIAVGDEVKMRAAEKSIYPCQQWRGRVIDCFANPLDNKGALPKGPQPYLIKNIPPKANSRARVGAKMDMGVKAINLFVPCCKGQRLGIFAGSGVGKSVLLSMFTKYAAADVKVIALIGERGREVNEFIDDYLQEEGMQNAVVIVSTSDEPALARRQAAYVAMAVAEYFRDQEQEVLLMMDSVTRFAMALREIGLAAGEPPTSKGYTPSVFAELPRLLERAGPGPMGFGTITGLFSTLVEGDDHNEPVADTVRSILDGHIVLDREIAASGRFPAVDIMKSVSRMMPNCNTDDENTMISQAKRYYSSYMKMAELITIGAYKHGSDVVLDEAITMYPKIEKLLLQMPNEKTSIQESYILLSELLKSVPSKP